MQIIEELSEMPANANAQSSGDTSRPGGFVKRVSNRNESASFSQAYTLRLLFAGGCHIFGFPNGPEIAFPQITADQLRDEFSCETKCMAYISLSKVSRVIAECRDFRPHVLVLQLGHYESGLWLHNRVRRLMGAHRVTGKPGPSARSDSLSTSEGGHLCWLGFCARIAANKLLTIAGYPPYSLANFRPDLNAFLHACQEISVPHVFLLSPFPCRDLPIWKRRCVMQPSFAAEAIENNVHYVEFTTELGSPAALKDPFVHTDDYHLGTEGHRRVGVKLAAFIRRQVTCGAATTDTPLALNALRATSHGNVD
jgi:hypothetical protein